MRNESEARRVVNYEASRLPRLHEGQLVALSGGQPRVPMFSLAVHMAVPVQEH